MRALIAVFLVASLTAAALAGEEPPAAEPVFAGGLADALAEARITVSGISSGGFFAQQLHLAYSDRIDGVGVLAAGPWGCAEGNMMTALGRCMGNADALPGVDHFAALAETAAAAGKIPPLANLADDRAWFFHGASDGIVAAGVAEAGPALYRQWMPEKDVVWVADIPAAHTFPTVDAGSACGEATAPFVAACDFSAAAELLNHLHGPLGAPVDAPAPLETLTVPEAAAASLLDTAYVHVPAFCREAGAACDVHIVLHGCAMSSGSLGTAFMEQAGYREWAEANGIVLLYPQVRPSGPNPYGCWDWWGYTGPGFQDRGGVQMSAVMGLVDLLSLTPGLGAGLTSGLTPDPSPR